VRHTANSILKIHDLVIVALLTIVLLTVGSVSAFGQKAETIEATSFRDRVDKLSLFSGGA
jgi:hypothetical protein